jgi:hypothetical protein
LDPSHVGEAPRSEGLAPHRDALAWFGWHDAADIAPPVHADDGTVLRYGCETVLVGPWWMFTLAQALETRRMHLRILRNGIDLDGADDAAFVESWLPIARPKGRESCASTRRPGRCARCTCSIGNRCTRKRRSNFCRSLGSRSEGTNGRAEPCRPASARLPCGDDRLVGSSRRSSPARELVGLAVLLPELR